MRSLKELRPDVEAVEFRGNVDTRLRKLSEGQVEAILLAAAGLDRLEKTEWVRQRLEPKDFCPAAGQGSLGIETRLERHRDHAALAFLDDAPTRYAVTAERAALAALGGGCQVPIGIHCRPAARRWPGACGAVLGDFRSGRQPGNRQDGARLPQRSADASRSLRPWGARWPRCCWHRAPDRC